MIKKYLIFLALVVIVFFSFQSSSYAVSSYDNTYSDAYNSFYSIYGGIQDDFIVMLNSNYNNGLINKFYANTIINRLNNTGYIVYMYYNSDTSYNGASPLDKRMYNILVIQKGSFDSVQSSSDYYGISGILQYQLTPKTNKNFRLYTYDSLAEEWEDSNVTSSFYLPYDLINYRSPAMTSWLTAYSSGDGDKMSQIIGLLGSIDESTSDSATTAEEIKDFLTDNSVDSDSMDTDVPSFSGGATVDSFFSSLFSSIKANLENVDSSVSTVSLPVPFTNKSIVLRSDMISSHIENTAIYPIIQACYWFGFSIYIILSAHKIMEWLQSGKVAEKGVSSFINYLDDNNPIIKSTMM